MSDKLSDKARVVFQFTVPAARTDEFLRAYEQIRYEVAAGVPGHLLDQVCQSATDPEQWLITSEWASIAHFEDWERTEEHRELVRPMRVCMENPKSTRYIVREQTAKGDLVSRAELIDAVGEN
jgi:heme-degrading monooxygenase HmoA